MGQQYGLGLSGCSVSWHFEIVELLLSKMAQMRRVRLLHWNAAEASPIIDLLRKARFEVEYDPAFDSALMREWRKDPPAAFVIDLSRLPAQGREIAIALRQSPKTRHIPLVFCQGVPEKVKLIRDLLPDASYCTVDQLIETLKNVAPVQSPVRPADMMNRYGIAHRGTEAWHR